MDNNQIQSLAREYAEEMIKGKPAEELPNCLKNSMLTMNTEYVAEIFQWLTRRFYLVEKSKVVKLCRLTFEHDDSIDYGLIDGLTDLVLELFPEQYHRVADNTEIAKEVEG